MKASTTLLSGLLILAAGIVLIICNKEITGHGVVTTVGILFLLAGIINAVLYVGSGRGEAQAQKAAEQTAEKVQRANGSQSSLSRVMGIIVSSASIILGICMFVFTETFAHYVPMLFGVLVTIGALIEFYFLALGSKQVDTPTWLYAFPGIMVICALVIFLATLSESTMMILTGVGCISFGLGGFAQGWVIGLANRKARHEAKKEKHTDAKPADTHHQIEDVPANQVKDITSLDK